MCQLSHFGPQCPEQCSATRESGSLVWADICQVCHIPLVGGSTAAQSSLCCVLKEDLTPPRVASREALFSLRRKPSTYQLVLSLPVYCLDTGKNHEDYISSKTDSLGENRFFIHLGLDHFL